MRHLILVAALLALPAGLWANHGHWIDRYRSASGSPCCGRHDCVKVQARLVEDRGSMWLAEVNGRVVELPKGSVHPSHESIAYWCHLWQKPCQPPRLDIDSVCGRCLFVAVGG